MVLISEFGFAGPFAPDKRRGRSNARGFIREQMDAFGNFDFVAGAIFWCYQDYRSHRNLRPGRRSGFVEMGVVDQNRQRNPSFYAWRKRNAPARLQLDWLPGAGRPSGFRAVIAPRGENEIPHYTLRGYRAEFAVRDHSGKVIVAGERALPDIGPAHQFEVPFAEPLVAGSDPRVSPGPAHRIRRRRRAASLVGAGIRRVQDRGHEKRRPQRALMRRVRPAFTAPGWGAGW